MISVISWTFLNDAMTISAKELLKNHTDKERFAAASSYFSRENGVLVPVFYRPPRSRSRRVFDLEVPNSVGEPNGVSVGAYSSRERASDTSG